MFKKDLAITFKQTNKKKIITIYYLLLEWSVNYRRLRFAKPCKNLAIMHSHTIWPK